MSFNHGARSITTARNHLSTPDHIWISDNILHRALRRLFPPQCPQRRGSFVPGPLEFRKRGTKRRIVGLASLGGPSPAEDPGFLAALRKRNQQEWQWQPPWSSPPAPEPPPPVFSSLPEWLTRPYLEEQDDNTRLAIEIPFDEEIALDKKSTEPAVAIANGPESMPLADFLVDLDSCNSFEDVVELALDRPFAMHPLHSHAAFRHLLKQNPPLDTILDFVEDSKLHSTEARNLQYLVATQLESIAIDHIAADIFCRWIPKQIGIGLMAHEELMSILTSVTSFSNIKARKLVYQSLYRELFASVAESLSYNGNPQVRAFQSLLRSVPQVALSQSAQRLGLEIVRSHIQLDLQRQASCLREFLEDWDIIQEPSVLAETLDSKRMDGCSSLLCVLQTFPPEMVKDCLQDASKELLNYLLMMDSPGDTTLIALRRLEEIGFEPWKDFAFIKVWKDLEYDLAQKGLKIVSNYVNHMDPRSTCIFVLKHWYTSTLPGTSTKYSSSLSSLLIKFEELNRENPRQKSFLNLLIAIESFKYPFPLEFQKRLLGLLRALNMSSTITALITSPKIDLKFDLAVIIDEIRAQLANGQRRIAYNIFQGTKALSLEHVPELAEIIIGNPNLRPRTAFCYHQDRNRRLSLWRTKTHSRIPQPISRVEMLNRLALAYAKAEHLSPRQAYKWAYRCYTACKSERLPILPAMTKALMFAGCGRYLQQWRWVGTARFTWILDRVREVEGAEVADRLDELVWEWRGRVLSHKRARREREKALGAHGFLVPVSEQERRRQRRWWLEKTPSGHQPSAVWRKADGE